MRCPWCGVENAVGAETCSSCGVILAPKAGTRVRLTDPRPQDPQYRPAPPQYQPPPPELYKKKNNMATIAIVILLFFAAMLPFAFILAMNNQAGVFPSSQTLEGTWTTAGPATFYMRSNWPGSGVLENVGSETREVTFVITGTSEPGTVQVQVTYQVGSSNLWNGSMYAPDISPSFFGGKVDGTTLTLDQGMFSATFSFSGASITGTWDHIQFAGSYAQEVYTDTNALTLYRQ